ncbi:NnrU family protein [Pseudaestuariivita atlantica]|uniref:NnrU domain-containing protein n=1 Tax=Pseudaestuariivita atlantica TaxID=1317121 RepID=A0A0L1JRN2_9RHOB|nr:NnrU family protein [Pseudaestuariivita atlantica]KNG94382.1 hypothetical protein ATO11_09325 [Pseudaestuariivita atlantica]
MTLLILGLILWTAAHLMRAGAPNARAALQSRMGDASKAVMGLVIIASVVLMVLGYRSADPVIVWSPPAFLTHVNNLLVLIAFYMYLTTATKPGTAFVFGNLKNPQLTGFKLWAFAHLLVNGDLASIILFGGLLAWAVVQVILSKRAPSMVDRGTAPISNPWVHLGLVLAVFAVVAVIHGWLGPWPFGG